MTLWDGAGAVGRVRQDPLRRPDRRRSVRYIWCMDASTIRGPEALTDEDRRWARDLADSMITTALAMVQADDVSETEALYAAVRAAALDVRTSDWLGAERWFLAMWYLAARSAGLLGRIAVLEDVPAESAWQAVVLHSAH